MLQVLPKTALPQMELSMETSKVFAQQVTYATFSLKSNSFIAL